MGLGLVFFGTSDFARVALELILESPHRVLSAVTAPDRPSGRGRRIVPGPVAALAAERGIPLLQFEKLGSPEAVGALESVGADVFAVASYGLILTKRVLRLPRLGCINAHGSLLPRLRGAAPIERAVLDGFAETGISIQRMAREVDAGDVYASRALAIRPRETAESLRQRLAPLAGELLVEVLSALKAGTALATPQDPSLVTYAPPLMPEERNIDWSENADAIDRRVRAFAVRPSALAAEPEDFACRLLKILESEPVQAEASSAASPGTVVEADARSGRLVVATGGGMLVLTRVQPGGGRPMSASDYLRGRAIRPGMVLRGGAECR